MERTVCGVTEASPELELWRALRSLNLRMEGPLSHLTTQEIDLSLPEFEILLMLHDVPEHRVRMSVLADRTRFSRSRLTHTVRRLEKRGLVTRFTCDSDRRGVHCLLTEQGESLVQQYAPRHHQEIARQFDQEEISEELRRIQTLFEAVLR